MSDATDRSGRQDGGSPGRSGSGGAHVCFLSSSAPLGPGGAYSTFILDLAVEVQDRGYRVTILTPHVAGSAEEESLRGVAIRRYRYLPVPSAETLGLGGGMLPGLRERKLDVLKVPFLLWGQARALERLHRRRSVDVLHSHWLVPQGVVGGRFARKRGIPHVATAHGSDVLGLRFPGVSGVTRYALSRSRVVTVNTGAMGEELGARTGFGDARVVPIGARAPDPRSVRENLPRRRSLVRDGHVVGFAGRLVAEKGIEEFVRLLARLRRAGVPAVGLMIGGGEGEPRVRRLARELDLTDSLHLEGPVPPERVPHFLSVMDTLVVPSRYEAQGLVAIEAMLSGVPAVGFATGGLGEVIRDGETGLTVEAGDVPALCAAVRRVLSDRPLRRSLSRHARERALNRYTVAATARRFDDIYRELLGGSAFQSSLTPSG